MGIAFTSEQQRVVLIDEIDKSQIDLPNNLLHLFEENEFEISELKRLGVAYESFTDSKIASKITIKIDGVEEEEITLITPISKRYQMGSNENDNEKPIHEVIINYDFEIAQTPVTVGEFRLVENGKIKRMLIGIIHILNRPIITLWFV